MSAVLPMVIVCLPPASARRRRTVAPALARGTQRPAPPGPLGWEHSLHYWIAPLSNCPHIWRDTSYHLVVERQGLTLMYTVGDEQATQTILSHRVVQDHCHQHQYAGINLATAVLELIRKFPAPILDEIRQAPQLRRLRGLL